MRFIRHLIATLLAVFVCAAHAQYSFVDSRFGADTVIHDSATGLDWLKPEVSYGVSYEEMWAALMSPGGTWDGFRLATSTEALGLVSGIGPFEQGGTGSRDAAVIGRAQSFLDYFGDAADGFRAYYDVGQPFTCGASGCGGAMYLGKIDIRVAADGKSMSFYDERDLGPFGLVDSHGPDLGAFLVAVPVPEPSTYALLGVGLVLIVFAGRRQRLAARRA